VAFRHWLAGNWANATLTLFGVLHLLFGALGLYLLSIGVRLFVSSGALDRPVETSYPYYREAFVLRASMNLVFMIVLVIAGFFLIQSRQRGVQLSNVLFIAMIVYFVDPFSGFFGEAFRRSMAVSAGIGDVGITWAMITGYPVVCLIALNVAGRKLRAPTIAPPASREHASHKH
jgi:hypothetical protein